MLTACPSEDRIGRIAVRRTGEASCRYGCDVELIHYKSLEDGRTEVRFKLLGSLKATDEFDREIDRWALAPAE